MDIAQIRSEFEVLTRWAYFDSAGVAPVPARTQAATAAFLREYSAAGILRPWDAMEGVLAEVRSVYSQLLHADPDEVIPVATSSEAINAVANAVDWRPGDNVVTGDLEYPSNYYPWINLKARGVEVRIARSRGGALGVDEIAPLVDRHTRVITATQVAYLTGYRTDLAALTAFARPRGILTVVDATQGVGAIQLDAHGCGADVIAASGFKWLLSPIGTGMLYVRREALDRLRPAYVSWMSLRDHQAKGLTEVDLAPDSRRFLVSGNFDMAAYAGMVASLRWFLELGPAAVEQRVLALSGRLIEQLQGLGLRPHTPADPLRRAGIVTVPVKDPTATLTRLKEAGVHAVARLDGVRFSPHFFNSDAEIDMAAEVFSCETTR